MQDFFTYTSLGTLTGAITATVLVVEFIKQFKFFKLLHTRWLVWAVAELIVLFAGVASGSFAVRNIPLYFLNGLLVAACAMGSWQVVSRRLFGENHETLHNGPKNKNSWD